MTTITKFVVSVNEYLEYLKKYDSIETGKTEVTANNIEFVKTLTTPGDLGAKINLVRGLPDLGNSDLKLKKKKLEEMVVDLEIINHTRDCINLIQEAKERHGQEVTLKNQEDSMTVYEKQFNSIYRNTFIVYQREDQIYILELDDTIELVDKNPYGSYYHTLDDTTSGSVNLWDMNITSEKWKHLNQLDSSDEEDELINGTVERQVLVKKYQYSSKQDLIGLLKDLETGGYLPYH